MGSACFTNTSNYIKKNFYICLDDNLSNIKEKEEKIDEENNSNTRIVNLKNYFIQNEKEILEEYNNDIKIKMNNNKKQRESLYINVFDNNKYETMLKKLLQQKSIERKGPQRRETIRESNQIINLVKEVLKEKNNNKNKSPKKSELKNQNSIIIKNKDKSNIRLSTTVKRDDLNVNRILNKSPKIQCLKNVNTYNEVLTDGNRSSVLNKKETNKV